MVVASAHTAAAAAAASTIAEASKPFNPLVQSAGAVLNLVACCGLGVTASKARVLDQQAISALSRLVYNVFQPSLLFTNVLQTLATPSQSRAPSSSYHWPQPCKFLLPPSSRHSFCGWWG